MERNHEPGPGLLNGTSGWQHNKSWTASQPKPYVGPLPYQRSVLKNSANWDWGGLGLLNQMSVRQAEANASIYAKTYDKFWNKSRAKAEALLNLVEINSSVLMAARRCQQIVDICKSLKKGHVGDAFSNATGMYGASAKAVATVKGSAAERKRALSDAYLEHAFGWAPIAEDLKNLAEVIGQDFGSGPVRARAVDVRDFSEYRRGRTAWDDRIVVDISGAVTVRCELGGVVVATNPNLFLANQLGIVNPGILAWDLLPGSFMLDWFLPVGKYLRSLSNEFGADIHGSYKTNSVIGHSYGQYFDDFGTATGFNMTRSVGPLTRPGLLDRARLPEASLWHLATLSALAEQSLRRVFGG